MASTQAESAGDVAECAACKKPAEGTVELKRCAKCHTARYCNRECQTSDWKHHKKMCVLLAAAHSGGASTTSGGSKPKRSNAKPFTAIYHDNFLHDRTEKETFNILIDTLRMKQEDTYKFEAETMSGTIYNEEPNSGPAFRKLLAKAKGVEGLLPPWWTDEKAEECIRYGLRQNHDFSLWVAQEKSDISEQWKDPQMPMKLRMLGEKIYGVGPGGQKGGAMLGVMMSQEGGDSGMYGTHMDMSQLMAEVMGGS